ncbi:methyltransferase domain-containing protein [Pedobacter petrophilus]|uniref:Methyltransferase domain-containing protein n=1 Tax=Pedobacter petrophilus TaxID=1908241 RepID=A0A7K0FY38_9SPHI|nr:bifunctional PIG-L family deacetylase/class I SAM-dependent methyltransferase [Pedobacter petrophilus]MRX76508.1 methyltransferase domain-containing protein [Pedobacter petrophilus]
MIFDKAAFRASATTIDEGFMDSIKRCLVLAPHPDDESLGCGGLISTLVEKDCAIQVILTTDGSQSHPRSVAYPPKQIADLRKTELVVALEHLGLGADNLFCYESKDSAMPALGEDGFNELSQKLANDLSSFLPQLILVPYELDPHRDHRATFQLLFAALKKVPDYKPKIWEYPIWLYEKAVENDWPQLESGELKCLDITRHLGQKRAAIDAHQTQTTPLIHDDPNGFILTEKMISNFLVDKEYFIERKKSNPTNTLSQDYFEKLYNENSDPWSFETSEYESAKYAATLAAIPERRYAQALEIGCSIGVLTKMLSKKCDHLISMDISETALQKARDRMEGDPGVSFINGGIPTDYPPQNFNLIVMSEVGYYLSKDDLLRTRELIFDTLEVDGILALVHWTHFVADYPLTGDEVHNCFANLGLSHIKGSRTADYRLDVYQKQR